MTPLAILDKDFNFVRVNKAYADASQRDISDFPGHNHFEFYPHEENRKIFEQVVKTRKSYQVQAKPFSYPDQPERGVTYWDWSLVPVLDEEGEVDMLVLSLKDVTSQKRAELALKESEEKYRSLVEFSPEAVCVLVEGKVTFANTAALKLLKVRNTEEIIGKSVWDIIHPDCTKAIKEDIKKLSGQKGKIPSRESKLICFDGSVVEVEGSATSIAHEGKTGILVIFRDITERKRAESRADATNSLLDIFARKTSRKEYLDSAVDVIRNWSGCRCVGIRLTNTENRIPYASCVGFSDEFLSLENNLYLHEDVCACVRVIAKTPEPQDTRVMTEGGSFCCNNTFGFIESLSEDGKKRFRGKCLDEGFASVAVVPVRYRQEIIGAIHLADEKEGKVPLDKVEFVEDMAAMVGEAVHRFNVEESLRINEKRLLEAQRVAHLGNWEWDLTGNTLWWSDEVYRIFGLDPEQFRATFEDFLSYIHPDDRKLVEESVNKALYEGRTYNIAHRIVRPDGSERIVNEKAEVTYDEDNSPVKMAGTVYDITHQKRAENEIRKNQRELRGLTAELQLAEEKERRRIARDLHDSIGQILSFSGRELKNLQKSLSGKAAKTVQEITNQLDSAVEQARTLSFDLSPSTLYDLGFETAIEDLVDRMSRDKEIKPCFENSSHPKPLADDVKVLLYRSVRELLINAVKYANPSLLKVSLLRSSCDIYIKIEDDGKGFDTSILDKDSGKSGGFGIFSIRERLTHIGGYLKIDSAEGKGTKATLVAPLDIEKENE